MIAGLLVLLLAATASAQAPLWSASPSAAHHMAFVQVSQSGFGGTGTCIRVTESKYWILSAGHIFSSGTAPVRIGWLNGAKTTAKVVAYSRTPDIAILEGMHNVKHWSTIPHIPLAARPPPSGTILEICGYGVDGDGGDNLRHYYAELAGISKTDGSYVLKSSVVSGDSGGGVIQDGKEYVGVIWGGDNNTRGLVWPAKATRLETTARWLGQHCPQCLPPGYRYNGGGGGNIPTTPSPIVEEPGTTSPQRPGSDPAPISQIIELRTEVHAIRDQVASNTQALSQLSAIVSKADTNISNQIDVIVQAKEKTILDKVGSKVKGELDDRGITGAKWWIGLVTAGGLGGLPGIIIGFLGWRLARRMRKRLFGDWDDDDDGSGGPSRPFPDCGDDDKHCQSLKRQLKQARETIAKLETNLRTSELTITKLREQLKKGGTNDEVRRLEEEVDRLEREIEQLKRGDNSEVIKKLEDQLARSRKNEEELHQEIQRLKDELRDARYGDQDVLDELERLRDDKRRLEDTIEHLKNEVRRVKQTTRTEYVHVPVTDAEAEAYKEAMRRVSQIYPEAVPYMHQVEGVANQLYHGAKVAGKDKRKPLVKGDIDGGGS